MKFPLASVAVGLAVGIATGMASAADMSVKITQPQLNVAEYHRPYVAVWIEKADQQFVDHLSVWYDVKKRDNGGTKWLKDMRQWWRKGGKDLQVPVDGVTGATRAVGEHVLVFAGKNAPLNKLAPGAYQLVVEASREAGGREVVKLPFQWPSKTVQNVSAKGQEELGVVSLQIKP
jgi:hypothetical protein